MLSHVLSPFRRRALTVLFLAAALAVGLSACGSSSNTSTAASSGAAGGTDVNNAAHYEARLSLAKCFRAHGVNVPDPSPNGGPAGGEGGGAFRALQGYSQAQIQSAMQACRQYIARAFPRLNLSPAEQARFRQQFVKFAQCMRSHGVDIPDPTTQGGGLFGLRGTLRSIDRNSPAFQSALVACQSLRPRFGRPAPAGPGASSGGASAAG